MSTEAPDQSTTPDSYHSPVRRFIKTTLWLIALSCLLLVATSSYLLGTTSGLRQLVSLSQSVLPGKLEIQQIDGTVLDNLHLKKISYLQPGIELSIRQIDLDWMPSALLSGKLHIIHLEIEQPVITQSESTQAHPDTSSADEPILKDITLPLQLQIDLLRIDQITLNPLVKEGPSDSPILVSKVELKLHSDNQSLILDQLSVIAPQAQIEINGQLKPSGEYPIKFNTHLSVTLPEKQPLSAQGSITGSLKGDINLRQTLSGLISTQLSASLQELLDNPKGSLQLDDFKTELGQFSSELSDSSLSGSAEAEGDKEQINFSSRWKAILPQVGDTQLTVKLHFANNIVRIDQLDLTLPSKKVSNKNFADLSAAMKMQGDIDISAFPVSFRINGHWNNLRYPFVGGAEYQSSDGQVQIKGNLQRYKLSATGSVAGISIPSGRWKLDATGSDKALNEIQLSGNTLDGTFLVNGDIAWQPQLSWNIKTSGQQLNPGKKWPAWPGKLDFTASINGIQKTEQPLTLQLSLASLSGVLRGEPITANAQVSLSGSNLIIPQFRLNIADTQIQASGKSDKKFDLNWSIDSPDLNHLMPNLKGRLNGSGKLRGTKSVPHLTARFDGKNLQFDNNQSTSLSADIDLNLGTNNNSHIQLTASDLIIAGHNWKQLSIDGSGTSDQHQLKLKLEEGLADLELSLRGHWQDSQWRGNLNQIDLTQAELGSWHIQHPTVVQLSSSRANLEKLCMESTDTSDLCLTAKWSSVEGIEGTINSNRLSLAFLQAWIPNQTELKGFIQADATFSQSVNKPPSIKAAAVIKGAELLLEEDDLHILAEEIAFNLNGKNDRLTAEITLPLHQPPGNLNARIDIEELSSTRKLRGGINLAVNDLTFVSLLNPALQAVTGQINSKMLIDGTLDQPVIEGYMTLANASTDLPTLGIKLEDINLSVIGEPGNSTLQLKGAMRSGNGPFTLNGQYNPVTNIGQISLKGSRFQAVATEEIKAWISPAIRLNIAPQTITLRGELTIPEASISPPAIEATSAISDDVVIIDSTKESQADPINRRMLDTQLRITLGDNVYLEALGFEGRLLGSILIEDDSRRATRATGIMQVATGQYRLYGQDLNIDRGSLIYSGGPVDNPGLDLRVSRTVDDVIAGAKVSGTLNAPRLTLFSEPTMPESGQLSYLMFGHAPGEGGEAITEQQLLFKAASALSLKGGNSIAESISETFNIDELGVAGGDTSTDTSLYIGKYLSPRLYVKYGVGLLEPTHTFFMRYKLSDVWSVETQTATEHNGGDLIYTLER